MSARLVAEEDEDEDEAILGAFSLEVDASATTKTWHVLSIIATEVRHHIATRS